MTIWKNNKEVLKLLIKYADDNHIILKINDVNINGDYPLYKNILFELMNNKYILLSN